MAVKQGDTCEAVGGKTMTVEAVIGRKLMVEVRYPTGRVTDLVMTIERYEATAKEWAENAKEHAAFRAAEAEAKATRKAKIEAAKAKAQRKAGKS